MSEIKGRVSAQGLDANVVEAFKEQVRAKYGKLHTVFGLELQHAMEAYMLREHTHTQNIDVAKKEEKRKKSIGERKLDQVEGDLQAAGLLKAINNGGVVYPSAVKVVMKQSVGLDPRTVNKYFDAFCQRNTFEINAEGILGAI